MDGKNKQETFKVYIHTLSPFTAYGPGAFAMSTLKRMTGTTSFMELPENRKKCAVHNRQECQTVQADQSAVYCNFPVFILRGDLKKNKQYI